MQPLHLRAETEIEASPDRVWQVLLDVNAYGEWNPLYAGLSGDWATGSTVAVRMSLPEGAELAFDAQVTRHAHAEELRLRTVVFRPWLLLREQFFQVRPIPTDRCRFVQGADVSGILLRLGGKTPERLARGFVYMNQALKRRVEGIAEP